jgi:hypothetical protein
MSGLGGECHHLLRLLYAYNLAPWLGGLMGQGTQHASRDSSHAYMLDVVKLLDNIRSKRLFKIYLG